MPFTHVIAVQYARSASLTLGGVATLHPRATEDPITDDRMALVDLLQKSGDGDFLRAVAEAVQRS
jgi:hypothetical protein